MSRKITYTTIVLFLFFLVACKEQPTAVLSESKMQAVMFDLYLFEGAAQMNNLSYADTIKSDYYRQILKKHAITQAQFDSSLVWYIKQPNVFAKMHKEVIHRLELFEQEIKANKFKRPIAPADSIDSVEIYTTKRDIALFSHTPKDASQITLPDSVLKNLDGIRISYNVKADGDYTTLKSQYVTAIYYADKSKDIQQKAITFDTTDIVIHIDLYPKKNKKITTIRLDLFKQIKPLIPSQQVYLQQIQMQGLYNPYRKVK